LGAGSQTFGSPGGWAVIYWKTANIEARYQVAEPAE
jgi:hypothetical protein